MSLEELGYNSDFDKYLRENKLEEFEVGRVVAVHKERYLVRTDKMEYEAEITGNMRYTARSGEDFPVVGDWVTMVLYDSDFALIHSILPRYSIIKRKSAGRQGENQPMAANIDYALLVQSVDRDFNINRLERYLTICYSSGVIPAIVLSKTDLADSSYLDSLVDRIVKRIKDVSLFRLSNLSPEGFKEIEDFIKKGKTYCMLGSSGAGKSSLMNNLSGKKLMKTDTLSHSTNKGKHVTSHRELVLLDNGGILIDNPGLREVGISDSAGGLEIAFDIIAGKAIQCRYANCTHTVEEGCMVIEAVKEGTIDKGAYENFLRLDREKRHYEATAAEKRRKDKDFGKILKNYKKNMKKNKL